MCVMMSRSAQSSNRDGRNVMPGAAAIGAALQATPREAVTTHTAMIGHPDSAVAP
jgi:hypothetical protein